MVVNDKPHIYDVENRYSLHSETFKRGKKEVKVRYDIIQEPPERDSQMTWITTIHTYSNIILEFFYNEHLLLNVDRFHIGNDTINDMLRDGVIGDELENTLLSKLSEEDDADDDFWEKQRHKEYEDLLRRERKQLSKIPDMYKKFCDFDRSGDLLIWAFDYLRKIEPLQSEYNELLKGTCYEDVVKDISASENAKEYFKRLKKNELADVEKQLKSLRKIENLKNKIDSFPPERCLRLIEKKFSDYLKLPFKERNSPDEHLVSIRELEIYRIIFNKDYV